MSQIHAEASHVIDASPAAVYAILSDYRVGHPAILPKQYFKELTVKEGGQGAGTVIDIRMEVMGKELRFHQTVSEPEPGRVLMESETDGSIVTTFTLDPINNGNQTRVTIATNAKPSPGITGVIERILNPIVQRRMYTEELHILADYAHSQQAVSN
jgi:hypothetical protein